MKKTISASSMSTYLACGQKYKFMYESPDGEDRGKTNVHMLAGTGYHAALEYALKNTLQGHEVQVEDAIAYGLHVVTKEWTDKDMGADLSIEFDPAQELDAILSRVKRAASYYLGTQFERLNPAISEKAFKIAIPGTDWHLTGRIDLIEADGTVRDFKLSGSHDTPATDIADRSEQLSIYALARYMETGTVPPSLELDYCRDAGKRVTCVVRASTRSEKDCERTLTRIKHVVSCIESGVYPIASQEGIECNGQRCQFWTRCPYGMGPVK